jgi:hypothetical protein
MQGKYNDDQRKEFEFGQHKELRGVRELENLGKDQEEN